MDNKDEAFLKKLLETFRVEAGEHIAAIASGLIEIEKSRSTDKQAEIIETIFREAHSMKGAARAVNLNEIEKVCQSLETVLAALKRKEIMPGRGLIDLLHRTVNMLGELLVSAEAAVPPEKAGIRDLIRELDSAAKGARGEEGTVGEKPGGEFLRPSPGEAASPASPYSCFPITADTMRVSKMRMDSILLQAEEFLSVKQMIKQRAAELLEITAGFSTLKKKWSQTLSDLRTTEPVADRDGAGTAADNAYRKKLHIFLESQNDHVSRLHDSLGMIGKAMERDQRNIAGIIDGLLDDLKTVSMLPFSSLLEIMPKVVRDLSHDQGKDATLTIRGGEIEIDRRILDEMKEPLIHLVRNCIDHGIEKPEERIWKGKPETGAISISVAHREGKSVEVVVSDDGRGIDTAKVRGAAVRLGILSQEEAKAIDDQKVQSLIFRSGVTASPMITDISGRGLGLAIVQEKVERLGGAVFCETEEGTGTTFRMLLPLSLVSFRGVLVRTADHYCIIPSAALERTVRARKDEIRTVENRETISIGGRTVPLVPLSAVLELPRKEKGGAQSEFVQAVVLGTADHRIGIAFGVDEVLHEQEVLEKDLGKQLVRVRNIAGATVLGTGKVVPILNVSDLLKSAVRVSPVAEASAVEEHEPVARKSILVVEDSITSRTLLKSILEASGYEVQSAVDGVEAFSALKTAEFDLVVSDVDMPRMNGFELTAKIRTDKSLAELPVVLVTALDSREDRERGIDAGANAYIVKSTFDQSNLIEVIRRLI